MDRAYYDFTGPWERCEARPVHAYNGPQARDAYLSWADWADSSTKFIRPNFTQ